MDAIEQLQQLGLTEYEARAYTAVLRQPGSTGYAIARRSGIPRAKIYEVLDALISKDLVNVSQEDGRTLYHPVAHDVVLRRYLEHAEQVIRDLRLTLAALTTPEEPSPLLTIRSRERILNRARDTIAAARQQLFVSAWPAEAEALSHELIQAERRSIAAYVLVYGDPSLPLPRVIRHPPINVTGRTGGVPWLIVVADHAEALIAGLEAGDHAIGLWTQNRTIAMVAAEYIKHDIFLVEAASFLESRGISLDDTLEHLQAMWFHEESNS